MAAHPRLFAAACEEEKQYSVVMGGAIICHVVLNKLEWNGMSDDCDDDDDDDVSVLYGVRRPPTRNSKQRAKHHAISGVGVDDEAVCNFALLAH